jgi:glycerol-3-phosphate dehydrogenase (NAD(P)+)
LSRIAVVGAGAWGTALAMVAGRRGDHEVRLWALEKEVVESINHSHVNELFLPGVALPGCIRATHDFKEAISGAEIVLSVMPSHHCRRTFEHMAQWLQPHMLFVSATKGVENDTLLRMTEVIEEVVGRFCGFKPQIGALSGPSFAREVAERHPTAVTVASAGPALATLVQK